MKRVLTQKVKPIPACAVDDCETAGSLKPVPSLANHQVRKKAATIGLAISMGASSLLLPQQGDGAMAAEPTDGSPVSTVPTTATTPAPVGETEAQPGMAAAEMTMPKQSAIPHQALEGQTIGSTTQSTTALSVARSGSSAGAGVVLPGLMEKSQAVAPSVRHAANGYRIWGQSGTGIVNEPYNPGTQESSAGEPRVAATIGNPLNEVLKVKQSVAIDRLRDSSNRLRSSLAEWKSEESVNLSAQTTEPYKPYVPSYANPVAAISSSETSVVEEQSSPVGRTSVTAPDREAATARIQPQQAEQTTFAQQLPQVVVPEPTTTASVTTVYKVQSGDTLSGIAQHYGVAATAIAKANQLDNPNRLQIAQMLAIPPSESGQFQSELSESAYIRPGQQRPASEPILTSVAVPTKQRTSSTLTFSVVPGLVIDPERDRNLGPTVPLSDEAAVPEATVASTHLGTDVVEPSFNNKAATGVKQLAVGEPSDGKSSQVALDADSADNRAIASKPNHNNPYIERLRAELSQLREQYSRTGHFSDRSHTAIAPKPAPSPAAPVNPQFDSSRYNQAAQAEVERRAAEVAPAPASPKTPQQVAAAPLGADPYQPYQPTPGQMVSPDLPPLGDPNQYLPGGSIQNFNGFIWPTRGVLTSGYGRRWGRMHKGIDVAAPTGTPIFAAASGVVVYARWNSGGYGNLVDIRHADGSLTRYGHNSRIFVQEGQVVEQGQHISAMGSTGFSTGPHLHFEVHPAGRGAVNPIAFLPSRR